jgi:GNAT superfamily N-acetyltransferase
MTMQFFVGLHQPVDAQHFDRCCISVNRVRGRKKPVECDEVLVDSGSFKELELFGAYRHSVDEYADELYRLHTAGVVRIAAAVAQDYMCEAFMLARTGLTIADHQRLTIERYDALQTALCNRFRVNHPEQLPFPVMPVLQGYAPADYARHVEAYGDRLKPGMWVGVGSVCKRNGDPEAIVDVGCAILAVRPDLRLHGFGVKRTALLHPGVRAMFATADSMAWSFAARAQGHDYEDGIHADVFELVMKESGLSFPEAVEFAAPSARECRCQTGPPRASSGSPLRHRKCQEEDGNPKKTAMVVHEQRRPMARRQERHRLEPRWRGGFIWNLGHTIYRHKPEIAIAEGKTILMPEGEKDVHTLEEWGLVATTNSGGARTGNRNSPNSSAAPTS